jgi:hypothetical protein
VKKADWQSPINLLVLMSIAMPIAFNAWNALLNNFVIERAAFTGVEIGILQSLREIPGFIAFTTVFVSLGFHYFEAVKQSLALQWLSKDEAPQVFGKLISVAAITSLIIYGTLWILLEIFELDYVWNFLIAGTICFCLAIVMWAGFPHFSGGADQHHRLILRKRYWLYYALTFFSGARRQIFMVFAAFLMVEKFGYSASQVTLLFLVNYAFNWLFAERIGMLIRRIGERNALTFEYGTRLRILPTLPAALAYRSQSTTLPR